MGHTIFNKFYPLFKKAHANYAEFTKSMEKMYAFLNENGVDENEVIYSVAHPTSKVITTMTIKTAIQNFVYDNSRKDNGELYKHIKSKGDVLVPEPKGRNEILLTDVGYKLHHEDEKVAQFKSNSPFDYVTMYADGNVVFGEDFVMTEEKRDAINNEMRERKWWK